MLEVPDDIDDPAGAPFTAPPPLKAGAWTSSAAATAPPTPLPLLLSGTLPDLDARRLKKHI